MAVIDTNDNASARIDSLRARGVTAVGRYYSTRARKRLTQPEAKALSEAGIQLFTVFEDSGDPELSVQQGIHDAQIALQQATEVAQPQGSAIYFAMEHLPNGYDASHVPGIQNYYSGLKQVLGGKYKLGVYSDGVVCDALLSGGACDYAWLSASTSFPGSKDFDRSGRWALAQRRVDLVWSGLSVDTNDAKPDIGAFRVVAAVPAAVAMAAEAPSMPQSGWTFLVRRLRTEKRDSKPFARTVGQYQVYVNGAPVPELAGMTVEREGPGDNGPIGKADHRCIEAGTYPLDGHDTENYTTVGFETDGDHPRPALEVGDTDARVAILIHPASGYGSTIGCINLAGSLDGPDSNFSLSDSTARVIDVINHLKGHNGGTLPKEGLISDCRLLVVDPSIDQIGYQSLRLGSRGPLVRAWQAFLAGQGFNTGGADGSFGAPTRDATIAFQNAHGLAGDGTVGPRTIAMARQLGFGTPSPVPSPAVVTAVAPVFDVATAAPVRIAAAASGAAGLTIEMMRRRWPNGDQHIPGLIEGIVAAAPIVFPKYGVNSPLAIAHFMAQASEECGQGLEMMENMNYSAEGLLRIFPLHFTSEMAQRFAHNPRMIADIAYGGRMGNAPPPSDDGFRFRGAGMSQVTGREGYAKLQAFLKEHDADFDILQDPGLIVDPAHTLESGVADWILCGCLQHAERDDLIGETRALNGGLNGLDERRRQLALWKPELLHSPVPSPAVVTARASVFDAAVAAGGGVATSETFQQLKQQTDAALATSAAALQPAAAATARPTAATTTFSVPAGSFTVKITVNVGDNQ